MATESFQHWVAQLCIGKTIQEVARLLQLAYTTVERWFYQYAPALLPTSNPTVVCVDEFAFRKGHDYGAAVMDTQTRNVLSIASGKMKKPCGGASTRRLQSEVCCQRLGSCHEKSH
ncbi:helix-turn-helix domain-containing protein [Geobacillus zalihae]|uniref:helix-turn-helix domain-containing protein n=1 Tax=Geobacillus zalihae TaxID=213419 RepID=UPI0021DF8918|nr:helix-turn-helix domain-containing protein [Geobacillus zalihae]